MHSLPRQMFWCARARSGRRPRSRCREEDGKRRSGPPSLVGQTWSPVGQPVTSDMRVESRPPGSWCRVNVIGRSGSTSFVSGLKPRRSSRQVVPVTSAPSRRGSGIDHSGWSCLASRIATKTPVSGSRSFTTRPSMLWRPTTARPRRSGTARPRHIRKARVARRHRQRRRQEERPPNTVKTRSASP